MFMLHIWFGDWDRITLNDVDRRFRLKVKSDWFQSDLAMEILFDIDRVYKIDGTSLYCKNVDCAISPNELAGGTKQLLLMLNLSDSILGDYYFYSGFMGQNCYKYVQRIAEFRDINLCQFSNIRNYTDGMRTTIHTSDRGEVVVSTGEEFTKEYLTAVIEWQQSQTDEYFED